MAPLKRLAPYLASALALVVIVAVLPEGNSAVAYPDPDREVRHVIPWRAGGGTDAAMRGFAQYFEKHLGVPVITENISGGLSAVGLLTVKRVIPDGYTLATMTYDVLTVGFLGLAPIDWSEFEPVCTVTDHPTALLARAEDYVDLEAFAAAARARPGEIRTGNAGAQGVWHQHAVAAENEMGIEVHHVPYEASSGMLAAILGGEVDIVVSSLPAFISYLQDGTLRALAVMSNERDPLVPDAPTFKEHGYDLEYGSFRVLVAPGDTPETVLAHLESVCRVAWEDPDFQAWAETAAIGPVWRDREETKAYLEALAPKVGQLMEVLGMR